MGGDLLYSGREIQEEQLGENVGNTDRPSPGGADLIGCLRLVRFPFMTKEFYPRELSLGASYWLGQGCQ